MSNLPPPSFDPPSFDPPSFDPPSFDPPSVPDGQAPLPPPPMPVTPVPVTPVPVEPSTGEPSSMIDDRRKPKMMVAGLVVVASVIIAVLLTFTLGGDDSDSDAGTPSDTAESAASVESAPAPTDPAETAPTAPTTVSPLTLPTTVPPTAAPTTVPTTDDVVDLGNGVSFPVPDGFTSESVGGGFEITDGTVRFFAQVSTRPAGVEPLTLAQEYIDGFDANFESASYSQAIPSGLDPNGVSDSDGYFVYYRVLDADGTGFSGLIDATRRADGLVYVTDTYRPIDDTSGVLVPDAVFDEFYGSYLDAPVVGAEVPLTSLALARVNSVHAAYPLDGVVAMSPPPAWTVDAPGPLRVAFSRSDGQRFVAARLGDSPDPLVAQDLAFAELQVVVAGATIEGFEPKRAGATESVLSYDTLFTAVDPGGRAIEGIVRVWADTARSQVFSAISFNFVDTPPVLVEEDFVLNALDISLVEDR